ncbi:MAG: sigma-54 dependent transcriptional regulator [Rhodanobacter sp.]
MMDTGPMVDYPVLATIPRRADGHAHPGPAAADGPSQRYRPGRNRDGRADRPGACVESGPDPQAPADTWDMRCGDLYSASRSMHLVFNQIRRVAPSDLTVMLEGESGTGKELAARAIHALSECRGPFVAVNCGAVAAELLASVLFGHARGSFTGAISEHLGLFEQAEHGTLFLDEITEMPYALQAHLLRVLENGVIRRVGGNRERPVDCRVVAATNRDSRCAVREGQFREDLFYRLRDFPLRLPPLRERPEDIFPLARYFLDDLNCRHATSRRFDHNTEIDLLGYAWPGNVRELKQVVGRAYLLGDDDVLRVEVPDEELLQHRSGHGEVCFRVGMSFEQVEQKMLNETLRYFANDKARTAAALGISLKTVYNRLAREESGDPAPSSAGDGVASM